MCLVEEEHQLRQVEVAHLGQLRVELAHQPQQERGVELRLHHQLVGCQHIHHALALLGLHQVEDVGGRLAEELVGTLILQLQQRTLDGTHGHACHRAELLTYLLRAVGHVGQHRAQVLQVEDEQPALVSHAEHDVHHALLRLVQLQQARQQLRSHLTDGGTHGVSLLAEDVEETHGAGLELRILQPELRQAFLNEAAHLAHLRDAAEVAFHVGHETGHASLAERFGHHLQGDRLSRTCGTRYQSVAVSHLSYHTQCAVGAVGNI